MKTKLIVFGFCLAAIASSGDEKRSLYPDKKLTPGAKDPHVTQATIHKTVCVVGYTATVRNVPESMKKEVMRRYGLPQTELHQVEIDHLISLENGGSNEIENLWPEYYEPKPGARQKDAVETALHRDLCAGKITLEEDQKILTGDWLKEWKKRFGDTAK
jgi:hypothetical protein